MTKTCLVVDDSRVVRKVARKIIEDFGFICEEAEDGALARDACEKSLPDAVLLDWTMPNMSGLEFLKALRAMPGGKNTKVVFCTAQNDLKHIVMAMDASADEYIMKPFDSDIIRNKFELVGLID